jgi:hypothetical protein
MLSTAKRRSPGGSGLDNGPVVGFGRKPSPIALASSAAAAKEACLAEAPCREGGSSRNCAMTFPAGHLRAGEPSVIGAQ